MGNPEDLLEGAIYISSELWQFIANEKGGALTLDDCLYVCDMITKIEALLLECKDKDRQKISAHLDSLERGQRDIMVAIDCCSSIQDIKKRATYKYQDEE